MREQAFFAFMRERESIRLRKEAGDFFPWTNDPILREYKFTNVRRHHDRTSQKLREMFYDRLFWRADKLSILMNCATFRYFGTWEFAEALGWQDYESFNFERIKELAEDRLRDRERVFTGAYVITNQGISAPKQEVVVDYFLSGLHKFAHQIVEIVEETKSWEKTARFMMTLNGFGGTGFMTKEVLLDTTYCNFWNVMVTSPEDGMFTIPEDWYRWTPIGPGARRGVGRVLFEDFDVSVVVPEQRAFKVIMDLLLCSREEQNWPAEFGPLSPHDIQFQLCEFDKYERVRLGQGKPRSKYHP